MLTRLIPATLAAAALILTPVQKADADTKDVIIGAIVGGAVIAGVTEAQKRKRARERAAARTIRRSNLSTRSAPVSVKRTVRSAPRTYTPRPSIPATAEGRELQSALNYFGFGAGTVDGQVGSKTKRAVAGYQAYLGYPATGTPTAFERHVLTQTYLRAEAGGTHTFSQIARLPDGARGLLKIYRQELAGSALIPRPNPTYLPAPLPYEL